MSDRDGRMRRVFYLVESRRFWVIYLLAMYAAIFTLTGFVVGRVTA